MHKSIDEILAGLPASEDKCAQETQAIDTRAAAHIIIDRWELLELVKSCRSKLRISDTAVSVLRAHLSVLQKGPLDSERLTMSYAQVSEVMERSGIACERRFRRGEQDLEAKGLIRRKLAPNRRRFPIRDGSGTVIDAFGIDLSQLLRSVPDLRAARDEIAEERAFRQAIKTNIRCRLHAAKEAALYARGTLPDDLLNLIGTVTRLLRRKTITIPELTELQDAVEQIYAADEGKLTDFPCSDAQSDAGDQNSRRDNLCAEQAHELDAPEKRCTASDIEPVAGGQNVCRIESEGKEIYSARALRKNHVPDVWRECTAISSMYLETPRTEQDLASVLWEFSGFLGLRKDLVEMSLRDLGALSVLKALDYIASRIDQIKNPSGYLSSMLQKWRNGEMIAAGRIKPLTAA